MGRLFFLDTTLYLEGSHCLGAVRTLTEKAKYGIIFLVFGSGREGEGVLFSSLSFLLYFLPTVILIHYFLPKKLQNPFLFLASLIFYAWGDARYVPLFFALLGVDWACGLLLEKAGSEKVRKCLLLLGVLANMGALFAAKYLGFMASAFPWLFGLFGVRGFTGNTLPLGISFFTFQAVGYLADVYRRQVKSEKNLFSFGAFLFLFPQLIAGPIVRYGDLSKALHEKRRPSASALETGMALFIGGLAAKTLLANPLGAFSEEARALMETDTLCAWLYLLCFSLQIYFDFMGYSVMAVGMGRMLGFSFPRNFHHPYAASSVTDFWRRWHITLSGWFRDYVYIPLGGSRRGGARTVLNLLIVWFLTGFWHGASWEFILWGLWYFAALLVDKYALQRLRVQGAVRRTFMYFSVGLGWLIFNAGGMENILPALQSLFTPRSGGHGLFWLREAAPLLAISGLCCVPAAVEGAKRLLRRHALIRYFVMLGLMILCLSALAESSYNPFLYFRF